MEMKLDQKNDPSIRSWISRNKSLPADSFAWVYRWFVNERHGAYGLAVMRMASGLIILGWLLINAPIAVKIWGPGSEYLEPYRAVLGYNWPLDILRDAGLGFFVSWYVVAILLAVAFTIGWKTRIITPLFFIFYTAINAQNTPISDGGNYFIRIMLIYLIFADLSKHWSFDAWLKKRKGKANREFEIVTVLHNIALCLIVAQLCIVYLEAGLYKVQGNLWQNGTAMYYPISSEAYGVFPWMSELLSSNSWIVALITYVTVIAQIAFPFMLFHRISRRIALITILGMHIGIAVVMGLPFFSGIMASADAVLVSGATWITIQAWLAGCWRKVIRPRNRDAVINESEDLKTESKDEISASV
ncbi:HTTM domain-containing protein [Glutamicibacter sp. AOP38-B1-38]|uniref:HTTM domain-containing protein n=1 Tax=Glutamicibacter sp. AOP38-B1-38 TaxID=3457680 RepID=UPI00403433BC